jgi:uncharacterized protein DUF4384
MRSRILLVVFALFLLAKPLFAAQSTITEVEGNACMGDDKSRKQTEESALTDAKKRAVESASTYIKSETAVKNFALEKDLLSAYAQAEVKLLQEPAKEWYKDPNSGDCLKMKIKAEVIPDTAAMQKMTAQGPAGIDDPSAPLTVKAWTDRKAYKTGEKIKVFLKGNKPFYARVIYKDASGEMVQILPNPYRTDNYFNGGALYEIPAGNDKFELEVSPPFGDENVIVYASSAPLGEIEVQTRGGVYLVKTKAKDLAARTRGIKLREKKDEGSTTSASEFFEDKVVVKTGK